MDISSLQLIMDEKTKNNERGGVYIRLAKTFLVNHNWDLYHERNAVMILIIIVNTNIDAVNIGITPTNL